MFNSCWFPVKENAFRDVELQNCNKIENIYKLQTQKDFTNNFSYCKIILYTNLYEKSSFLVYENTK